jgi:UDP-N-acetyl-D-glucosamine dehydrogenase
MSGFAPTTPADVEALPARAMELAARIDRREARVGVIGLGYVGLPLALLAARRGFAIAGYDHDRERIAELVDSRFAAVDTPPGEIAEGLASGRLRFDSDPACLSDVDVHVLCLPTPLAVDRTPDLGAVEAAAAKVAAVLRPGSLVILESTTYPGTTEGPLRAALDASGLRLGDDYFLAHSPERQDPGNRRHPISRIPRVVGGVDATSGELAARFYGALGLETVRVSNARAAEATKLLENIYRAVNIALVNELKTVYDRLDVDVWEALDAASTKPFGFARFDPGPGWGGHCIPLDPYYLSWIARRHGAEARFVELAGEINRAMPAWVIEKLEGALDARGRRLAGSRILVLGLAYKRDIDDTRESPAFELLRLLVERGARPSYHDPHVARLPAGAAGGSVPPLASVELSPEIVAAHDAVLLVTDHRTIDYEALLERAQLVVDTRGVYRRADPRVVRA